MSSTIPAVLIAAGGVGLAHAVLPDHWVPLAVIARTRRDPLRRVVRLSLLAGLAHVVVSLALGAVVVAVGLSVRSSIQSRADLIVGVVLIVTGLAFLLAQALGRPHAHDHTDAHAHAHGHTHDRHPGGSPDGNPPHLEHDLDTDHDVDHAEATHRRAPAAAPRGLALLIPFGAAASPDLTILPVFLAAAALGAPAAAGSLVVFAAVTIATFVALTTAAVASGRQVRGEWIDRYANVITAGVLIAIGILVTTHVI